VTRPTHGRDALEGRTIVCFGNDWDADPTSKHHIMRRLARHNTILWIEAAGMRRPDLTRSGDGRRLMARARAMLAGPRRVAENIHVLAPPTVPLPGSRVGNHINSLLYRVAISRALRSLGVVERPILWVFAPHVAPWIRHIPRSALIYYCVDRWSAFKGYDAELMKACEAELCRTADLVVATADDLVEQCRLHRPDVHYMPHGVDYEHFATALDAGPLPDDLAGIPVPRIGFFGLIHEWVDIQLVGRLASALPYSFVLIGSSDQDLGFLRALPNVHVLGRRPFDMLPAYCRGFAATMIPFRESELTRAVNPIKLREYAAAGLAIVSTDLPEVRRCGDIVTCATDDSGWISAITNAVERGGDAASRNAQSARVRDQDWSMICRRMGLLLAEATNGS
jgi:glycosyltransferase involved in cell wall biosynthesis